MPSDPQRIQAVFLAAAEIHDPAERARFLDGACDGDAELRSRVEALLRAHDQPDSLLDHPAGALHDPDTGETRTVGHEAGAPADGDEAPLPFLEPSTRPDSLGRIGHYEVLQILGRGGFGIVFRAFDEVLQRVVALKVLAPAIAATSPARKRFLREARSSAQVRHENVVQVYAVEEQPLPYLVMEFIPGETLQQRLDRVGPMEAPEIVRIGRQIAEGLAAAHATGLIHRDIKPANVLLEGGHQRVKITDFGLARAADDASLTQSGMLAGTPMYMAPEQAKGEKIDHRADLFSLGSVFYVMAAGRPPFRASTSFAVLKRVVEDAPRPIRELIPEMPQWLCRIVEKLHAKDPAARFQSAREVADLLADCEKQLHAHKELKDFARIPEAKPGPRRRIGPKWKWAAAALALVLLLGGAWCGRAAMLYFDNQAEVAFASDPDVLGYNLAPGVGIVGEAPLMEPVEGGANPTLRLGPGAWQMEAKCKPGRVVERWEVTTNGLFTDRTRESGGERLILAVGRGERLTVRPVLRDVTPTSPAKPESGWVQLFNGKDLTGWKTHPDQPGDWRVEGGVLVGRGKASHLFSDRGDYGDFHLRVEAKLDPGGNSGVCFRSGFELVGGGADPNLRLPPGFEADINDTPNQVARTGTLWRIGPGAWPLVLVKESPAPAGAWLTLEVIAVGGRVTVKVNGRTTADWAEAQPARRTGHVALQVNWPETTVVRFRKIEIKELPPGKTGPPPTAVAPFSDAELKRIAALPAEAQVEEVRKELMRRNPGFDGKVEHKIEDGVVTEIHVVTDNVTDVSPLRVFNALRALDCSGTHTPDWRGNGQLADLTPLKGMNLAGLTQLNLSWTRVGDAGLALFKDCKNLTRLYLSGMQVGDAGLALFKDCKSLVQLTLDGTQVTDVGLAYFKDCKNLTYLGLAGTQVTDAGLALFKDCKNLGGLDLNATQVDDAGLAYFGDRKNLRQLGLAGTKVSDAGLGHFKDSNLTILHIEGTKITDLSLLKGMPLRELSCDFRPERDAAILRSIKTLETINGKPAAEFWKSVEQK